MIKCAALLKDGVVYTGKRHCDIFKQREFGYLADAEQGFITTYGMWVTREEAAIIALQSGQIEKLKFSDTVLFSEDLY